MSRKSDKTSDPLLVRVGLEAGGSVYALDPRSEDRVRAAFPQALMLPTVFFGYRKPEEFESLHKPLWPRAVELLTGLTGEDIALLGGVRFYNPRTRAVVWEWLPDRSTGERARESNRSGEPARSVENR
jgi:hypothetical protein